MGGVRAICSYNRWAYKGTLLNGRDRLNHRGMLRGGLRPNSAYIRGDNYGNYCIQPFVGKFRGLRKLM